VKTIVVTGGTGDLGRAILPRLEREYRCIVLRRTDDPSSIREEVYAIVNLAGAFTAGATADDFTRLLDANLLAAVRTISALAGSLSDGGRIVAISSIASLTKPAGLGAYVASKAALNAYLEVLAKELAPRRITVNAIAPSAIGPALVPPERIAETILFLLSDAAASISGAVLPLP